MPSNVLSRGMSFIIGFERAIDRQWYRPSGRCLPNNRHSSALYRKAQKALIRQFKQFRIFYKVCIHHFEHLIGPNMVPGLSSFPQPLGVDQILAYLLKSSYLPGFHFEGRLIHLNHTF